LAKLEGKNKMLSVIYKQQNKEIKMPDHVSTNKMVVVFTTNCKGHG